MEPRKYPYKAANKTNKKHCMVFVWEGHIPLHGIHKKDLHRALAAAGVEKHNQERNA
jgi:hypothetical protein